MTSAITAWQASYLLIRLRVRRQWNLIRSTYRFRKAPSVRTATAPKSSVGSLLSAFVLLAMLGTFINLSHQSMTNINKQLGTVEVYKEVRRGWLGTQITRVSPDIAERLSIRPVHGALIVNLADGGPARRAGLQPGDVIVEFGGKYVKEARDLPGMISLSPPGKNIKVAVVRDGRQWDETVELGVNPEDAMPMRRQIAPARGSVLPPGVLHGATLETTLLLLAALLITLASREITRPEWDLEWLVTLPLPMSTLLSSRLIERAVTNSAGLVMLGSFLFILAWECGYRWTAALVSISMTFALLLIVATFQTLVDTGLRLSLSPPKLRNLHAVISIVSVLPMLLAMSTAMRDNIFVFDWAAALPEWTRFLPTALAVRALAATDYRSAALWSGLLGAEILAVIAIGYAVLQHQLRNGVVAAGARESVGRLPRSARRAIADSRTTRTLLPAVHRRELRLLGRDRSFMAQTMLLPAIIVGAQVFINARTNIFVDAVEHPENLAAIAFALAAYMLMLSAFQTLNTEGQALWILYSVPHPLESILRQKAKLWAAAAVIYPLIIFVIAIGVERRVSLQFISSAAIVLLGIPIFAVIATALGVFGCDPLAQEVQRRVRPAYLYLYMVLSSLYVYAVYASTIWQRMAAIILTTLLAIALWQKARDHFDYLLDPSASPPARVSVSDGLIAALMFFVLQALVIIVFQINKISLPVTATIWIAFCVAGAVTFAVMRLVYWRAHTIGVPRVFGVGVLGALLWGLGGGLAASVIGLAYIEIATAMGFFVDLRHSGQGLSLATAIGLIILAVAAAPVFEEFIFRGLIFGGLRRSLGLGVATLASAGIFAIIHPPMSVIPVFFMAVFAALIYERTKMLAAPMVVHAVYNATVLGFQLSLMP